METPNACSHAMVQNTYLLFAYLISYSFTAVVSLTAQYIAVCIMLLYLTMHIRLLAVHSHTIQNYKAIKQVLVASLDKRGKYIMATYIQNGCRLDIILQAYSTSFHLTQTNPAYIAM